MKKSLFILIIISFVVLLCGCSKDYKVTFKTNNNVEITNSSVKDNKIEVDVPTLNGYEFKGWYLDNDYLNKIDIDNYVLTEDTIIYGKYEAIKYTIKYKNEGSIVNNPSEYTIETETIVLEEPTKQGYTFLGWFEGETKITKIEKGSTGDKELEAKFTESIYKISYINGSNLENPEYYGKLENDLVLKPAEKKGYTFLGWFEGETKIDVISKEMTRDLVLEAKYEIITYELEYMSEGSIPDNPESYTVEDGEIILLPSYKEGYTFLGWFEENEKIEVINESNLKDYFLEARFEINKHIIKYYVDEELVSTVELNFGDRISDYKPEKDDYKFLGWFENDEKFTLRYMPDRDLILISKWEYSLSVYNINYNLNGGYWQKDTDYKTRQDMTDDFINDYKAYTKAQSVTLNTFFDVSFNYGKLENFFNDEVYKDKWLWMKNYIIDVCTNNNYIGIEYLTNEDNEYHNAYLRSNVHGFINGIYKSEWPQSFDFSEAKYSDGYYSYLPGDEVEHPKTFTVETETFSLVAPTKDYNTFLGWFNKEGIEVKEIKQGSRKDIYLEARWLPEECTITYELNGGQCDNLLTKYEKGTSQRVYFEYPTKEGYAFMGYYQKEDFSDSEVLFIEKGSISNYKLYAKWVKEELGSHKRISIYGDSVSTFENYIPSDATFYYPVYSSTVKNANKTWWKLALEKVGAELHTNISYSGSTVSGESKTCGENSERIKKISKNNIAPDIIIVYLGINDCAGGYSETTFKSSYVNMINKMKEAYPKADIFICTLPYETWTDGSNPEGKNYPGLREKYNEIIKDVSKTLKVQLIDIAPCITSSTESMEKRTYLGDNIHPNALGMEKIADAVSKCLLDYYKLNI